MRIGRQFLRVIKNAVFGDTLVPQEFTIGLEEPQGEISLWLNAADGLYDVTERHTTACTAPLILCIGFHDAQRLREESLRQAVLKYCGRGGRRRVLGEIRLGLREAISIDASRFLLFGVQGSTNYCLPRVRLRAHYVLGAYARWRRNDPPDIRMTLAEERAAAVTFIRPHPLCLVSVGDRSRGNIFTMNLMGDLGNGYFGFALRDRRVVADVVERAGRIAISGLPLARCALAYQFAAHYTKESVDWEALPFETVPSATFGIPVPEFATSVREVEIVKAHRIGSHRLFIARTVHDEERAGGPRACVVHGFYQVWRTEGDRARLRASVAEDRVHKRGA